MARISARTGKVMIDASSAANAAATVLQYVGAFTIDKAQPPTIDVTALGDSAQVVVQGLVGPDTISFDGFVNIGTTAFTQISDGSARKTYIYPDFTNTAGTYWYGTPAYGGNISGAVQDALKATLAGTTIGNPGVWVAGP